jgi:hypothetical protein
LSVCARADVAPAKPAATPFTHTFEAAPYRLVELDSEGDSPRKHKKGKPILLA